MKQLQPIETVLSYDYTRHLGPRFDSAGIKIEILPSNTSLEVIADPNLRNPEYFEAAKRGVFEGLELIFPNEKFTGKIIIRDLIAHEVHSSEVAFLRGAKALVASIPGLLAEIRPKA
ncbi:hypothetical protein [Turneriella parva]|uniref:Uncharacterized protein n=1 Tax=Turneriella parva (strain ATCC BAA-1111 / DSM 21527 / NCTC 11395 / H) TaxID=869212 RepID=I4B9N5_TURPD|nr:hypothetical protein [Turneriella parva]AFM13992.1 hypothetical protein Turpa_3354 [Turneriella parva DSM 21527]